jgi:tetratricopeptide (TPR) repeat protein
MNLAAFDLTKFEHPLRSIKDLTPERRVVIFELAGDKFNARIEELRSGKTPSSWATKVLEDGKPKRSVPTGLFSPSNDPFCLLPNEMSFLFQLAGDRKNQDLVDEETKKERDRAKSIEGEYYYEKHIASYMRSGQFAKAILVGEIVLQNLGQGRKRMSDIDRESAHVVILNIIAHSYEMLGAFPEVVGRIAQLIAEYEKMPNEFNKDHGLSLWYKWLARIYLKMGDYSKAADMFSRNTNSFWMDSPEKRLLTAELCLWAGDKEKFKEKVDKLYGEQELSSLAKTLNDRGLFAEAAEIYGRFGEKSSASKPDGRVRSQEKGAESSNVDTEILTCSCGETLQPHWKVCPSCGKSVELVCSCGESLKAGWKLCPACGKKISE